MSSKTKNNKFCEACPLKRETLPSNGPCHMAVDRLRWMDSLERDPTEEEESQAPGCPWYIRNSRANYCYFLHESKGLPPLNDIEIGKLLNLSTEIVKDTWDKTNRSLSKNKNMIEMVGTLEDAEDAPENRLEFDDLFT